MDKRQQLINVLNVLAQLCEDWNDAVIIRCRGRDNEMLVLTLWEDGSGRIGTTTNYGQQTDRFVDVTMNTQQVFENVEHAADYLLEWVEHSGAWQ